VPTGYTAVLEENNYDLIKWLKVVVPRNFGLCFNLRDEPLDAYSTEYELRKKIGKGTYYHKNQLQEEYKKLDKYEKYTKEDWEKEKKELDDRNKASHKESKTRNGYHQKKHKDCKKKIKLLLSETDAEAICNFLKFALDQLDLVQSEHTYLFEFEKKTLEEYIKDKFSDIRRDIKYHIEEDKKEEGRIKERLELYDKYISFISKPNSIKFLESGTKNG